MARFFCLFSVCWGLGTVAHAEEIPVQAPVLGLIVDLEISATHSGVIVESNIEIGDLVEEGQLLAQLDDREARLLLDRAHAEFEIARAEAEDTLDIDIAEKAHAVAVAELKRAEEAKSTYDDAVSDTELDALRYTADQAKLKIERAKRSVELARLRAQLQETAIERAEFQLQQLRILAPITGQIVQVQRHAGESVQPGQVLYRIIRTDRLRAEGYIDPGVIGLRAGMPVLVTIEQDSAEPVHFEGRTTFIDPEVSPVNSQYRILAEIDNPEGLLRPGQKVGMTIQTQSP